MPPKKITLSFIFLLTGAVAGMSLDLRQDEALINAEVGQTVTLHCFYEEDIAIIYSWYKQIMGSRPQLVSTFLKYQEKAELVKDFKDNSRLSVQIGNGIHHLKITDLSVSDSATYYCAGSHNNILEFSDGTFLNVNMRGSNIHVIVQQPISTIVPLGDSLTLNCTVRTETCLGEHSISWFRHDAGESHPGIIYTHGNRSDQCEKSPEAGSPTQSCVYKLPMGNLSLSDAGTYYCAVASCGEILFGNGTKVDIQDGLDPMVFVYCLEAALALASILIFILAAIVCKRNRRKCQLRKDTQTRSAAVSPAQGQESDNLNYAALRLSSKKNRPRHHRDQSESVCVYSGIRE